MRYYSNLAKSMKLTASVSSGTTVLPLDAVTGLPTSFPFTLVIEPGQPSEEIVTVTGLVGTSATVTRGDDGTSATSHEAAVEVRHMLSKRDLSEPQVHIAASTAVHGLTGRVVGTTDAAVLENKTISGLNNTFTNIPKSALPPDTTFSFAAQTLTNKVIDGASNTFTNVPTTALPATVVYTADTQTLTGKTIDCGSNTLTNIPKSALPTDTVYLADTGWLDGTEDLSPNYSGVAHYRRLNGVEFVQLDLSRTGASLSGATTGVLFTAPPGHRPTRSIYADVIVGTAVAGRATLAPDGTVICEGLTISNGSNLHIYFPPYPAS